MADADNQEHTVTGFVETVIICQNSGRKYFLSNIGNGLIEIIYMYSGLLVDTNFD